MNRKFITDHWYAGAYEQFETQINDVEFIIKILHEQSGGSPLNILEVACGGGRISVPLAQAGHTVTGFDSDEFMLLRCYAKMKGIPNISCYQADALNIDWDSGFDVVLMAGNILINIKTETDYVKAQQVFIKKSAEALRPGGNLILDYDQHSDESAKIFFNRLGESGRLGDDSEYSDELGTRGNIKIYGNVYNPVTRICTWASHLDIITNNGERIIESTRGYKHIPALEQVYEWLEEAGFIIERTFKNYTDEPLSDNEPGYARATILARKA